MSEPATSDEVIERLRSLLPDLKTRYKIASTGLFGSVVRGDSGRDSDIDVLVEFAETRSIFDILDAEEFLSQALRGKVDPATKTSLTRCIGRNALAEVQMV